MARKILAIALMTLLILQSGLVCFAEKAGEKAATQTESNSIQSEYIRLQSYDTYLEQHADKPAATEEIIKQGTDILKADEGASSVASFEGRNTLVTEAKGSVTWQFTVRNAGMYNLAITYYNIEGNGTDIERTLYLDGKIPFEEVRNLVFYRTWKDSGEKIFSKKGNEYRRDQKEVRCFTELPVQASTGYRDDTFSFYLSEGEHTITLEAVSDRLAIERIRFYHEKDLPSYDQWLNQNGYKRAEGDQSIRIQGEDTSLKSDSTLYAVEDRTSPVTEPYAIDKIQLNCVGGDTWKYQGDWIEWTVDVKNPGLYQLLIRAKQSYNSGTAATRTLYVNGEIPFQEAKNLEFPYNNAWQMVSPVDQDGNACYVYLKEGENTIRLKNTLGPLGNILQDIEESSLVLNQLYRKIRMVVGNTPDQHRNYNLESYIPDLKQTVAKQQKAFTDYIVALDELAGGKGEQTVALDQIRLMLESFLQKPDTIPVRVDTLSDNLSSLSSWTLGVSEQALLIDCIDLLPSSAPQPVTDASWYQKLWNELQSFVYSFVGDYNLIEQLSDTETYTEVSLWLSNSVGRDQASIIKHLAESTFTRQEKIQLNLELVDMSVLLRAVSAGNGPDVSIFMDQSTPVNYGMRSALYDLNTFEDVEEVTARFSESAVTPFRMNNKLYALPESQVYPMMFYRKDILTELGLKVPDTWDELTKLVAELQKKYMVISLPTPASTTSGGSATQLNSIFTSLLFQHGGQVYNDKGDICLLNSKKSVSAFLEWSELYTKFKVPITTNALSYFRTGDAPIVIDNFSFYNQLIVGAPEIKGLWDMMPIPGTVTEDGKIDRSCSSSLSSCFIFANAQDPEASWNFLKWWTSDETQIEYGREIEALQGPSGRWMSANKEARKKIAWNTATAEKIASQFEWVKGIPEVAGGYYVGRSIDNAVKIVINNGASPRETLLDYVSDIQQEIAYKRKELRME